MLLEHLIAVEAADVHDLLGQRVGHDVHLTVGRLDEVVQLARVERDGEVAGQRPDRGRPDDEEELAEALEEIIEYVRTIAMLFYIHFNDDAQEIKPILH